jgi:hypothetical protein
VQQHFRPEFVNRVDEFIVFQVRLSAIALDLLLCLHELVKAVFLVNLDDWRCLVLQGLDAAQIRSIVALQVRLVVQMPSLHF